MPINLDHTKNLITTNNGLLELQIDGALKLPSGTTANRPGTPVTGQIRFNTSLTQFEAYNGSTWVNLSYTSSNFDTDFASKTTDDLNEGATNLYYTQIRFDTDFAAKTTTDLSEGTNLYYTDERVDDRVNALLTDGTNISTVYNDVANTLTISVDSTGGLDLSNNTTTDLAEGTNLYYTQARFDSAFSAKDTDDLSEGATNLYYTQARFDTDFAAKSTTDLSEGTNLYFTDERVDDRVNSLLVAGSNISLTYDDVANTLTIASTGGVGALNDLSDVNITTPVDGALFAYNNGTGDWEDVDTFPNQFDTEFATKTTDDLTEGATNLYYTQARFDTDFAAKSTTDLSEGTNLYFTDERVDDRVNNLIIGGTNISTLYDDVANTLTINVDNTGGLDLSNNDTDDLSEGVTNFYYTQARFDTDFAAKTTDDLTEGATNLYFTDERVDDRVNALLVDGTNISTTYDDVANTLTIAVDSTGGLDLSNNTTTDLAEGTNLYYTDGRVDTRIAAASVTDLSDVSSTGLVDAAFLIYDTGTLEWRPFAVSGDVTITDGGVASVNSVQADSVALGTDTTGNYVATISGTANEIEVTGSGGETAAVTIGLPNDVTISNDLVVSGNLTVSGTTTTVNTETVTIADNIIVLNSNEAGSPTQDAGIEIERGTTANVTLLWDETADKWTVGTETFVAATFEGDLIGNVTGQVSDISNFTTDDLSEGATNLYYTQARFDSAFAAKSTSDLSEGTNLYFTNERVDDRVNALLVDGTNISTTYDDVANTLTINVDNTGGLDLSNNTTTDLAEGTNLYYTQARFDSALAAKDTDDLSEGAINFYYTQTRFDTDFATKTTDDLTEGTNLYFTDERVDDRVNALLVEGSNISLTYDDVANTLTIASTGGVGALNDLSDVDITTPVDGALFVYNNGTGNWEDAATFTSQFDTEFATKTTDDLTEGTNLYFTDERVDDRVNALLIGGTNISTTYDDVANTLTIDVNSTGGLDLSNNTTTDLAEGTNLYYTQARFDSAFAAKDTDDLSEGATNLYYTQARFDTDFAAKSTTDLSEGTNLYYTDERVDDRVNALLIGGTNISTTYDDVANTLTINVDNTGGLDLSNNTTTDLAEGTNLYYTQARFDTDFSAKTTDDLTEGATNLYFTDERVDDRVNALLVAGSNISLTYDDVANTLTIASTGGVGALNDLSDVDITTPVDGALLAYNNGTGNWEDVATFASQFDTEFATKTTDDLSEGATNLYYTQARFDTDFAAKSTSDLSEGTNLYFTDERVDDRVSSLIVAGTNISSTYDDVANTLTIAVDSTGGLDLSNNTTTDLAEGTNLYYTQARFDSAFSAKDTDDLSEGTTNFYYTQARFDTDFAAKSTTDLSEGTNLYYTDERVDDRINALVLDGTNISTTYDDVANTFTIAVDSTGGLDLSNNTTTDLAEGTNLYYTDGRVDTRIAAASITDLSDVSATGLADAAFLIYDSGTLEWRPFVISGDITVSDTGVASVNSVQADSVALGTDTTGNYVATVSGTANEIEVTGSGGETAAVTIGLPNDVTIGNDLTVNGNLTVSGTTTTVNTETVTIADNIIVLNSNEAGSPTQNAGFEIERGTTANVTLLWDETADKWTVGTETFVAATFEGDLIGNVTGQVSDISNFTTDDLTEGATNLYYTSARFDSDFATKTTTDLTEGTNLYYTDERVDDRVNALLVDGTNISTVYDDVANTLTINVDNTGGLDLSNNTTTDLAEGTNLYYTQARFDSAFAVKDTDDLSEGATNLYYTQARFDTDFSGKSTTDLTEGTNLYYTDERVDDRVNALLIGGTNISTTYDDVANTLTINVDSTGGLDLSNNTTTDLAEGTNLYYTQARFDSAFAAKSTSDLSEGTNLYFTDERVDDRVNNLLIGGTNITLTYDDVANTLTIDAADSTVTQEEVQDFAWNVLTGTQTLITVTYDDANNNVDFIVNDDLSLYDNTTSSFLSSSDIGTTVQAWDADLDTYSANPLTAAELTQLQNINANTISSTQWGYLAGLDQALSTTSNVTFNDLDVDGTLDIGGTNAHRISSSGNDLIFTPTDGAGGLNATSEFKYVSGINRWVFETTVALDQVLYISGTQPTIDFTEDDAATDETNWRINAINGAFRIDARDDTNTLSDIAYLIDRSGDTVTEHRWLANGNNLTWDGTDLTVPGNINLNSSYQLDSDSNTLATTTETVISTFTASSFRSAKFLIEVFDTVTSEVQVSELLIVHDGTTASATEYGLVFTGSAALASFDVDINTGNVRLLATSASTNSTDFNISQTLMIA